METGLRYFLLGTGGGGLLACLAMACVLVHRASGVLNLAVGSMAMVPALTYANLRTKGVLLLPWWGPWSRFEVGKLAGPVALGLAVGIGALLWIVIYLVVFHPLREATAVTKAVASVGVALMLAAVAREQYVGRPILAPGLIPYHLVSVLGGVIPSDRLVFAGTCLVLAGVVATWLRRTRSGLVLRAASSNERGVLLLGHSPLRSALIAWGLAGAIASLGASFVASFSSVGAGQYSFYAAPALGAALAGRFRSVVAAALAGLGIGGMQALAVFLGAREALPRVVQSGFDDVLPFLVIIVVLVVAGRTLPNRATLLERRLPRAAPAPPPWTWALLAVAGLAAVAWGAPTLRLAIAQTAIAACLALSIVISAGFVGQVTVAQLSIAGLAAYLLAGLTTTLGVPFPIAPILAIGIAAALGALAAIPALRIRGALLLVVSLAFALAVNRLVLENPGITGADLGVDVAPASLGPFGLGIFDGAHPGAGAVAVFVLAAAGAFALVGNLRRSSVGRRWLAVRGNERAAAASGIDVVRTKLLASAVSLAAAGVGGVMMGMLNESVSYRLFESDAALDLLALTFLCGVASLGGAVLAGLLAAGGIAEYTLGIGAGAQGRSLLFGAGLVVVCQRGGAGITGGFAAVRARVSAAIDTRRAGPAGTAPAGTAPAAD